MKLWNVNCENVKKKGKQKPTTKQPLHTQKNIAAMENLMMPSQLLMNVFWRNSNNAMVQWLPSINHLLGVAKGMLLSCKIATLFAWPQQSEKAVSLQLTATCSTLTDYDDDPVSKHWARLSVGTLASDMILKTNYSQ